MEFKEKQQLLRQKSFTKEFLEGNIVLDVEFDKLQCEVDPLMIYNDGGIMGLALDLNENNKNVLSSIIKDFDAYNELIDIEYSSAKEDGQTDLISIIEFSEKVLNERILYDTLSQVFYYE